MKRTALTRLRTVLYSGLLLNFALLVMANAAPSSAKNRQQFQAIASHLDLSGDLMLVVNTDTLVDHFFESAIAADAGIPAEDPQERDIREAIERVHTFLNRNGFTALHGAGLSDMPQENGLHSIKLFIGRDYADSNLPLWRGLVGWHPRRLLSLDFLPAETEFVRAGTPELSPLWQLFQSAVNEVAAKSIQERFTAWQNEINQQLGVDVEEVIESLRDEVLVAVTLSDKEQSVIPTKDGLVSIPAPEFLIVISTGNDLLRGMLEAQLAKHKISLTESQVGDILIRSAKEKLPSLVPMQPAYATQAGFLIIGSTHDIVASALLAYRHKNGLLARPDFRAAFQGLSMVNNGLLYMSPTMGDVMGHIRDSRIDSKLDGLSAHPAFARIVKHMLTYGGQNQSGAFVIQNWKKGVMIMGNSSRGAKDIMTRMAAHPTNIASFILQKATSPEESSPFAQWHKKMVSQAKAEPSAEQTTAKDDLEKLMDTPEVRVNLKPNTN